MGEAWPCPGFADAGLLALVTVRVARTRPAGHLVYARPSQALRLAGSRRPRPDPWYRGRITPNIRSAFYGSSLPDGGFYREVRIPNLHRGLPFGDALGPDLPPPRPGATTHALPPGRGPHPGRRDRHAARPPPVHHLPGARPPPLPRRRPRVLRLLPPERPGPGAPTPAAPPQVGHERRAARARGRALGGRLVAPADRRPAQAGSGRRNGRLPRDHLPPRLRPGGPRGGPPPPPGQGAAATREPLRPQAPLQPDPARALDREPAGGDQEPVDLRALGGRPADLRQAGRQGERDLARGAQEPVHLPAGERGQALGRSDRGRRRRAPAVARERSSDGHLRPRDRVRRLSRPRPRTRRDQLLLRPA